MRYSQINILSILLFLCVLMPKNSTCADDRFAVAKMPTPVLNVPDFPSVFGGIDGATLKTDRCGLVRELEFIALPDTAFRIIKELKLQGKIVYQVQTGDYTSEPSVKLYIDSRFVTLQKSKPNPRYAKLPSKGQIIQNLLKSVGNNYVWGGNISNGVSQLKEWFYNGEGTYANTMKLAGVDCSGLLYQATNGWTPRNSSQLLFFGDPVDIGKKSADKIATLVKPLDIFVWDGHVIIVLDAHNVIESRPVCGIPTAAGVVVSPLIQRISEIMSIRKPVDNWNMEENKKRFVVRRWYRDNND